MATAKKKKAARTTTSKSEFIRSLPKDMPAKEVVEKAAEKGIKFTEKYVYVIRSAAKAKSGAPKAAKAAAPARKGRANAKAAAPRASRGDDKKLEAMLRQAIADCGLVRSREIFDEVAAAFEG
jgi:hypothetical protein